MSIDPRAFIFSMMILASATIALWSGLVGHRRAIVELKSRVDAIEKQSSFEEHTKTCRQCRGDVQSEEGGPAPLCEEGFRLFQKDARIRLSRESH